MNKDKVEFKNLNAQQLLERCEALRHDLFGLRLNGATAHIKDYSQFKKIKKNIARALTYFHQKAQDNR